MTRRERRLFNSALIPLAILCCGFTPAVARAAASASVNQSVLLGSSQEVRKEFDELNVQRVAQAFADMKVGSAQATVSPEDLQLMLGPEDPVTARSNPAIVGSHTDAQLATVEIATRAPPGIHESAVQAQIPYGFAGMAWAFQHPTQAWRLLLPVLGGDSE